MSDPGIRNERRMRSCPVKSPFAEGLEYTNTLLAVTYVRSLTGIPMDLVSLGFSVTLAVMGVGPAKAESRRSQRKDETYIVGTEGVRDLEQDRVGNWIPD